MEDHFNYNELISLLLIPDMPEPKIVKAIKEMSAGFTKSREKIGEYVLSEAQVSAYAAFYLPTNMPKLTFVFEELLKRHGENYIKQLSETLFVDYGSGPGTFSLAYLNFMQARGVEVSEIVLIDTSSLMLSQAKKILQHFYPQLKIRTEKAFHPNLLTREALIFFGHAINELADEEALGLFKVLSQHTFAKHLFWIEPGTPAFFNKQKNLRSLLLESNYQILYPCACNSACPMDSQAGEWCHQILRTTHSLEVERLSQLVSLDRKIQPMTVMCFSKSKLESHNKMYFPVRFLNETKFSFDYLFCAQFSSNELSIIKGEVLKKHLTKSEEKNLKRESLGRTLVLSDEQVEMKKDYFKIKK